MANKNNLEGLRCPMCKQEEVLQIHGETLFRVVDDGTESHGDVEWDQDAYTRCPECGHEGKLQDFHLSSQIENPPMKTYKVIIYETRKFVGHVRAPGRNEVNLIFQTEDDVKEHCIEDLLDDYLMDIKVVQEVENPEEDPC